MADKSVSPEPSGGKKNERQKQRVKATLDQMRREQARKERRKTMLFVGIASITALAIIGVAVFAVMRDKAEANKPAGEFGVAASEAGCDPEIAEASSESGDHVKSGVRVEYRTSPPASGQHDEDFLSPPKPFYSSEDSPRVEQLVHSLEHGHLLAWYNPDMPQEQIDQLKALSERMVSADETDGYFVAAPWPGAADERDELPAGKNIVLTRWGTPKPRGAGLEWRQACAAVSGEAVRNFSQAHPPSDAPEAGAA